MKPLSLLTRSVLATAVISLTAVQVQVQVQVYKKPHLSKLHLVIQIKRLQLFQA